MADMTRTDEGWSGDGEAASKRDVAGEVGRVRGGGGEHVADADGVNLLRGQAGGGDSGLRGVHLGQDIFIYLTNCCFHFCLHSISSVVLLFYL